MAKITLSLIITIVSFFTLSFTQSDGLSASVERGKSVYETHCMSCHMAEGQGLEGAFPPLAKTGRLKDKGKMVKFVLNGMSGPITVNGKEYDMEMIGVNLNDQEVTDVLNYIRNSWGNKNPMIKVGEIKSLKDSSK